MVFDIPYHSPTLVAFTFAPSFMRRLCAALMAAAAVTVVAGCGTTRLPNDRNAFPETIGDESRGPGIRRVPGFTARLRGINGAAVSGAVSVYDRDKDMMVVTMNARGLPPGLYAMAFHENGNCTSPNGFSAGRAWLPPGAKGLASQLLPEFTVGVDSDVEVTARLRGVRTGGDKTMSGRSVLIYHGGQIQPIKPDVPNNAVACGVFEPSTGLF
jgi:Cu-Zn family superoxide dismutase